MQISLSQLLFVGLGGFFGANARFLLSGWVATRLETALHTAFPYGTLAVNVIGSFLLAVFGVWAAERAEIPENIRLLVGTGFFGAFTTFSTYANESVALFGSNTPAVGIWNILLNNGLCILGVVLGLWIMHR